MLISPSIKAKEIYEKFTKVSFNEYHKTTGKFLGSKIVNRSVAYQYCILHIEELTNINKVNGFTSQNYYAEVKLAIEKLFRK